jgi:hypothetical protein
MLRGAAAAWMGLVVLQAVTTKRGADTVGGLLGTVDGLVKRALDPSVPAIPDHSKPLAPTGNAPGGGTKVVTPDGKPSGGVLTPDGRYLPPTDATLPQPNAPKAQNESYVPGIPGTTTYT